MPNSTRQLAAIMFTDIVGYTRLMGENEEKAMQLLRKNRNLHKSIIKKHQGQWLKEMGDGTLASFKTTSDASYCAGELMQACIDEEISLRIGIHQGEVTMENGDVFGDGVNVASRLEPMAEPGQVLVSEPIHRNVKNKVGISSTFLREVELKNVDEPVRVYQLNVTTDPVHAESRKTTATSKRKPILVGVGLLLVILIIYSMASYMDIELPSGSEIGDKSIAVLAFDDMSPKGDQEYFCDGISEEIINNLAQIKELKVIGRSSSFQFKGQNPDHREIGEKLHVSTFLEGSIRKSGDQIRITAQLINVADGSHVWSQTYDRDLEDIFKIQDEISQSIADQLKVSLGLQKQAPVNMEIYDRYLRARTLLHQRGPGVDLSIKLFQQILDLDSTYQPAWTGLAQAWIVIPMFTRVDSLRGTNSREISLTKAHESVEKALSLNPIDAEGLAAKATILNLERKHSEAYDLYKKALAINDQSSVILEDYAQFLMKVGYAREAMSYAQKMIDIDPLTPLYLLSYSATLVANGMLRDAVNALKKALSIDPDFQLAARSLVHTYLYDNQLDSAIYVLENYPIPEANRSSYLLQINAVKQQDSTFDFSSIQPLLFFALNELNQQDLLLEKLLIKSNSPFMGGGYNPIYAPDGLIYHVERFISDPRMKEAIRNEGLVEFWKEHGWPDRCRPIGDDDFICE